MHDPLKDMLATLLVVNFSKPPGEDGKVVYLSHRFCCFLSFFSVMW